MLSRGHLDSLLLFFLYRGIWADESAFTLSKLSANVTTQGGLLISFFGEKKVSLLAGMTVVTQHQ